MILRHDFQLDLGAPNMIVAAYQTRLIKTTTTTTTTTICEQQHGLMVQHHAVASPTRAVSFSGCFCVWLLKIESMLRNSEVEGWSATT